MHKNYNESERVAVVSGESYFSHYNVDFLRGGNIYVYINNHNTMLIYKTSNDVDMWKDVTYADSLGSPACVLQEPLANVLNTVYRPTQ